MERDSYAGTPPNVDGSKPACTCLGATSLLRNFARSPVASVSTGVMALPRFIGCCSRKTLLPLSDHPLDLPANGMCTCLSRHIAQEPPCPSFGDCSVASGACTCAGGLPRAWHSTCTWNVTLPRGPARCAGSPEPSTPAGDPHACSRRPFWLRSRLLSP
jgi:hypothetical protein